MKYNYEFELLGGLSLTVILVSSIDTETGETRFDSSLFCHKTGHDATLYTCIVGYCDDNNNVLTYQSAISRIANKFDEFIEKYSLSLKSDYAPIFEADMNIFEARIFDIDPILLINHEKK